jgi:hypothetical protein
MTTSIRLDGLDAQNPLGFLAALGLLRVLDRDAMRRDAARPKLWFADQGRICAHISSTLSVDEMVTVILADAASAAIHLVLQFAYDESGARAQPGGAKVTRDLKPLPSVARALLEEAAGTDREAADFAAGCFSELVQDNNGNSKPTALHFTAGQQQFLAMAEELRTRLDASHLGEALLGPWIGEAALPSMSWDSSESRIYALRAGNPSKEKRGSVAGANWLGLQALPFFPVHSVRRSLATTCVIGGWKDSRFTWPVWVTPIGVPVVAALLRMDVRSLSTAQRQASGVQYIYEAAIRRSDQGGYGSFTPAASVLPRRRGA